MANTEMIERANAAREKVMNEVIPALVEAFAGKIEAIPTGTDGIPHPVGTDGIPQIFVAADAHVNVALWLKERGFHMLVDITAADYYPKREPRFDLVYMLREMPGVDFKQPYALGQIRIRVKLTEREQVATLSHIWPMANAAEREVWDQFGIVFKNHPNLTRILNPDDWEGHPLRRDYPLRGPRALINLEMPADEGRYHPFVDEEASKEGK